MDTTECGIVVRKRGSIEMSNESGSPSENPNKNVYEMSKEELIEFITETEFRWHDEIAKYIPSINVMSFIGPKATIEWTMKQLEVLPEEEKEPEPLTRTYDLEKCLKYFNKSGNLAIMRELKDFPGFNRHNIPYLVMEKEQRELLYKVFDKFSHDGYFSYVITGDLY